MIPNTTPQMPMGASAILPLNDSALPSAPRILPAPGSPPPTMGGMIGTPAPASPDPASNQPPYQVEMQPDGSSIYFIPGASGTSKDGVVVAVNPAPKLPKSLQPQE